MHQHDLNRVYFYSVEDMAGGHQLSKGEKILRAEIKSNYSDVNEVLELYNIKKYFDNELYLKSWTQEEIEDFKQKAKKYGEIVWGYFSTIRYENVIKIYEQTLHGYIPRSREHLLLVPVKKKKCVKLIIPTLPHESFRVVS